MGSSVYICKDLYQLVGLRVVRGPDWDYDTQDGGEGCVGTVIAVVGNARNPRNVKVRWDSGEEFVYRMGAEDAHDLRVLDNSTVGIKHPGIKCEGCNRQEIAGLRWQCIHCPTLTDWCTFCFINEKHDEKHDEKHVNFRRYDKPSSDPIVVHSDDQPKIQLKGIFPGALVRRGEDWQYVDEDGGFPSVGKVVPSLNVQHGVTPGKVWVQWPHEKDKSYPYRVGFNGQMDLKIARAGVGGRYQPHTLPILKISKPKLNEKKNDVDVALPLVVGDTVKFTVGLEELREIVVDCGLQWIPNMEKVVNEVGEVKKVDKKNNSVKVKFPNTGSFWIPDEKAMKRLIPWLPVDSVVQVSNGPDMGGYFGRVKKVNSDGTTVEMEFLESGENRTISVSQLKNKLVDTSLVKKVELIRKDLAELLVMEVDKGAALSVEYLLKNYPNIVDCRSSYKDDNCTALSVACQKGNLEMVKLLLQCKASVDSEVEDDDDEDEDDDDDDEKYRPIHHAVWGNHPEILKQLLQNGASPNHKNFYKNALLHLAAKYGYVECLKLLLEDKRCDPSVTNRYDKTAYELAVASPVQSLEILNLLHDAAIKLNITEKHFNDDIFNLAIIENNIKAVHFMLNNCQEGKIFAKQIDFYDDTTLNSACKSGYNQVAKLLVSQVEKDENGKPWGIDTPNKYGTTPLMRVIGEGNYELIEFLIEAGANLQATDKANDTPFHYAASLFRQNKKLPKINWPNEETAPQISKLYNELESKHPEHNLCPAAANVYYLALKGGIPTTTLRDLKNLISDDFLFGEISQMCYNGHSMVQNVEECPTLYESISSLHPPFQEQQLSSNRQENLNCQSQPQVSTIEDNDYNHRNLNMLIYAASTSQPHQFNSTDTTQQPNNFEHSQMTLEEETMATMTSHQEQSSQNGKASGDYNNSITQQQQPLPSSLQQSDTFNSSEPIMLENQNSSLTMTPSIVMYVPITDTTTSCVPHTSSDNKILEQAGEPEDINMSEMRSLPHASVDTSVIDPTKAGTLLTCSIKKNEKFRKTDGSTFETWILIDDQNRRYSQQKKNVPNIFQCTANVYSIQNTNKKCKGSIRIPDSDLPKLEELKKDPGKNVCTFTVGNAHEEHLSSKRARQSTDTESEISSTSGKRKRKT